MRNNLNKHFPQRVFVAAVIAGFAVLPQRYVDHYRLHKCHRCHSKMPVDTSHKRQPISLLSLKGQQLEIFGEVGNLSSL